MLASRAAPPSSAPMAMAPVWTGAAPVLVLLVVVLVSVLVLVLVLTELVNEAIWDEREEASLPVAVESTDDSDASELLRRLDEADSTSEERDDDRELSTDDPLDKADETGLVEVVVAVVVPVEVTVLPLERKVVVDVEVDVCVDWAAAREATARTATATRILAVY